MRNGQSVDAIIANNPELFAKYARSTIYGWIEDGLFSSKKHNLPFAGTRCKPHKRPEIKTNAKCRVGRTYEDMTEWLKEHPHVIPTEADTVIGSISGKVLFTFMIRGKFPLAFLRDAKTSQTFTRIINMLWENAGPSLFRKMFRCILPDNGSEFSDPKHFVMSLAAIQSTVKSPPRISFITQKQQNVLFRTFCCFLFRTNNTRYLIAIAQVPIFLMVAVP